MSFASFDKYIVCVLVKGGETREASAGRVRFDRIRQTSSANLIATGPPYTHGDKKCSNRRYKRPLASPVPFPRAKMRYCLHLSMLV